MCPLALPRPLAFWGILFTVTFGTGIDIGRTVLADEFDVLTEDGGKTTLEAKLLGSGQGATVLELPDGQLKIVPQAAVVDRRVKAGPEPLTPQEMADQLSERFGEELFRYEINEPYVIGLVLAAPLPRQNKIRARGLLGRAGKFMQNVERTFEKFVKSARLPLAKPRFPLVLLIFETDDDFEKYTVEATGNRGLSAGNIAGFYSHNTNWLAVRLSECQTFEVPLHEAIHQQVYNRELFQRMAPVPAWFNEGIATGFEGDGSAVNIGPMKINSHYARKAAKNRGIIDWDEIVGADRAFRGDVLAGDAYTHAWGLHWMLINRYEDQYRNYVRLLGEKEPLAISSPEERRADFLKAFGKSVDDIQSEFPQALSIGVRRQRISMVDPKRSQPGISLTESGLGEVSIRAVSNRGILQTGGVLKNVSPLRNMDFYICLVTSTGMYAEWYQPNVPINRPVRLNNQAVTRILRGAPGGTSGTFVVMVKSTVPGTEESKAWARGALPRPGLGNQ